MSAERDSSVFSDDDEDVEAQKGSFAETRTFRVIVLLFICLITFGSYFSYDNPGAIEKPYKLVMGRNQTSGYALLYSIYSWPNVFLPFLGGWLIDNVFGLRRGALICCLLVLAGNALVAIGPAVGSPASTVTFAIAIAGRFIFGLGGETLTVSQNTFCARWFRSRERATAFAIVLSFSRLGSAVNFNVEPAVYDHFSEKGLNVRSGIQAATIVSAGLCFASVVCCIILGALDKYGEKVGAVPP